MMMLIIFILSHKQGGGYDVEHGFKEYGAFGKWLQCYQNPKMKSLTDRKRRTIWFDGEPGLLVPKGSLLVFFFFLYVFFHPPTIVSPISVIIKAPLFFFSIDSNSRRPRTKQKISDKVLIDTVLMKKKEKKRSLEAKSKNRKIVETNLDSKICERKRNSGRRQTNETNQINQSTRRSQRFLSVVCMETVDECKATGKLKSIFFLFVFFPSVCPPNQLLLGWCFCS